MIKSTKLISLVLLLLTLFSGCEKNATSNQPLPPQQLSLDSTIISIANKLKQSSTINFKEDQSTVTTTSFVDLNMLNKTTQFGRLLGESMLSELFRRGFNITDFRGQGAITINQTGEFYITRDSTKLQNEVPNTYILVGTYTKIEDNTLINVRIIDNHSGKLIASAREIYEGDYCELSENCGSNTKRVIRIITDNCAKVTCPTSCSSKVCNLK